MKPDAETAFVIDGHSAEELAIVAPQEDGAADLDIRGGKVRAKLRRRGLEDERGNHAVADKEDHRQAAQALA